MPVRRKGRTPQVVDPTLTPYQRFACKWANGCGSEHCPGAPPRRGCPPARVVLCRGSLPCDVLFVGEGPGESENVEGAPFVGPAGKLLDDIVEEALEQWQVPGTEGAGYNSVRWAFTNLVGCVPREPGGSKATEPDEHQIRTCAPRLQELVTLACPRLIVCVGTHARDWLDPKHHPRYRVDVPAEIPRAHIVHPAHILRSNVALQWMLKRKCVITVRDAVEELFPP
jgi:uracil-DNA glycosylase family 4